MIAGALGMVSRTSFRRWSREETVIVFNLYCRIPFKDSSKTHPDVLYIASLVGRSPDSVNMKIGNFGSLDPELKKRGIKGLQHASRLDREVWNEFNSDWQARIDESERLINEREQLMIGRTEYEEVAQKEGKEKVAPRKVRGNQDFFRRAILSAYESRCCITGIDVEPLLVASHIKPWVDSDRTEKLNPQNGLCLNALHDRAFDRGLVTITDNYTVLVSSRLYRSKSDVARNTLLAYEGRRISLPSRFAPRSDFLAWHREYVFEQ